MNKRDKKYLIVVSSVTFMCIICKDTAAYFLCSIVGIAIPYFNKNLFHEFTLGEEEKGKFMKVLIGMIATSVIGQTLIVMISHDMILKEHFQNLMTGMIWVLLSMSLDPDRDKTIKNVSNRKI